MCQAIARRARSHILGERSKVSGIDSRKRKSGRGQPQSKTLAREIGRPECPPGFGLRLPSAAFSRNYLAPAKGNEDDTLMRRAVAGIDKTTYTLTLVTWPKL